MTDFRKADPMSESAPTYVDFRSAINHLHGGYRASHVHHTPPDVLVDDVVTFRMVLPHLLRAAFFFLVPVFVAGVLYLGVLLVTIDTLVNGGSGASTATTLGNLVSVVYLLLFVLGIVVLFFPIKEPIAEYSQLIEGRAWAAGPAYYWIDRTATEHDIDFGRYAQRVGRVPVMFFRHGRLQALITVRVYGDHLFLGWTMWRARSTMVLIGHFLRDVFGRLSGMSETRAELRASEARAMREIVHSLVREGVQAAIMVRDMIATTGEDPQAIEHRVASLPDAESATVDPFRQ